MLARSTARCRAGEVMTHYGLVSSHYNPTYTGARQNVIERDRGRSKKRQKLKTKFLQLRRKIKLRNL